MAGMKALRVKYIEPGSGKERAFSWLVPPGYKRADVRESAERMQMNIVSVTSSRTGEQIYPAQEEAAP